MLCIRNTYFQILVDETGLNYVCQTAERFFAVSNVLSNMVAALVRDPSVRLLKHIIRCYLRLSENPYAPHTHLRSVVPDTLHLIALFDTLQACCAPL
jgi:CCR4-NOT transcription complex subunit 9